MTTINQIIGRVEAMAGHRLNRDEGLHMGEGGRAVRRVTVAWMATLDAIRAAGVAGDDLLIAHESIYYPYDVVVDANAPLGWEQWKVNRQRRELAEQYGLSLLRLHGSVDEICIFDVFAGMLGLGKAVHVDGLVKVYEMSPRPLRELIADVKRRVGMEHVRVAAENMEAVVRRVGVPWGGLGLFVNVGYQQRLVELGCDVFIAGESDSYGFRFAVESGIPMIETSHEVSENPGLRRFTQMLASDFADVEFRFYENACIWRME